MNRWSRRFKDLIRSVLEEDQVFGILFGVTPRDPRVIVEFLLYVTGTFNLARRQGEGIIWRIVSFDMAAFSFATVPTTRTPTPSFRFRSTPSLPSRLLRRHGRSRRNRRIVQNHHHHGRGIFRGLRCELAVGCWTDESWSWGLLSLSAAQVRPYTRQRSSSGLFGVVRNWTDFRPAAHRSASRRSGRVDNQVVLPLPDASLGDVGSGQVVVPFPVGTPVIQWISLEENLMSLELGLKLRPPTGQRDMRVFKIGRLPLIPL